MGHDCATKTKNLQPEALIRAIISIYAVNYLQSKKPKWASTHCPLLLGGWQHSNLATLCCSITGTAEPTIELNQLNTLSWRRVISILTIFCYLHHFISLTSHSKLPITPSLNFFQFYPHVPLFRAPERFVWLMAAAEDPTVESSSTGGESSLG
jgi:hypothetical protein